MSLNKTLDNPTADKRQEKLGGETENSRSYVGLQKQQRCFCGLMTLRTAIMITTFISLLVEAICLLAFPILMDYSMQKSIEIQENSELPPPKIIEPLPQNFLVKLRDGFYSLLSVPNPFVSGEHINLYFSFGKIYSVIGFVAAYKSNWKWMQFYKRVSLGYFVCNLLLHSTTVSTLCETILQLIETQEDTAAAASHASIFLSVYLFQEIAFQFFKHLENRRTSFELHFATKGSSEEQSLIDIDM